jgi:hypothetical protein
MIVELRCDAARPRTWIASAAASIASRHSEVFVNWVDTGKLPPAGLDGLFKLEHLFLHRDRTSGAAMLEREQIAQFSSSKRNADVIIDFTDVPRAETCNARSYLRPLYNGLAGEDAALTAALTGDMPVIDIVNEIDGRIVDRGHPSSEVAVGLSGSLETIMARTTTLLNANLPGTGRVPSNIPPGSSRADIGSARAYVFAGLARAILKRIYHLCCYAPQWHIGWRFTDDAGVWRTMDLSGPNWQRLPDRAGCFYADPFPMTWHGRTFVFFEELEHRVGKGVISAIEFNDAGPTGQVRRVLEEPWHLSYPFLIEDKGELWMIPESSTNNDVCLYRCVEFPDKWERYAILLSGFELADATVTRHGELYYLFGAIRHGSGGYSDTLAIYYADQLTGPWQPHEKNPIIVDRASARPGGNFVRRDGRLWRPVQDCSHGYGAALGLAEVIELSPSNFNQVTRRIISPTAAWPGRKLHTLSRHGRLEVIDGSRIQPKVTSLSFR